MSDDATIEALIAKYAPDVVADLRVARAHVAGLVPRGHELVYETYNTLAFGFCPTARSSSAVVSVAAYPRWVTLFFLHGATLDDPQRVLEGAGSRVRSVRLRPIDRLRSPEVGALLAQALARHAAEFAEAPPLSTRLRAVAAKERARRPRAAPADRRG